MEGNPRSPLVIAEELTSYILAMFDLQSSTVRKIGPNLSKAMAQGRLVGADLNSICESKPFAEFVIRTHELQVAFKH